MAILDVGFSKYNLESKNLFDFLLWLKLKLNNLLTFVL